MKKIAAILCFSLLIATSCDDFLDVNEATDSPATSTPNFILPAVLSNSATSIFDHGDELAYITQQLATFSGFDKYKDRWDYVTANRVKQWRRHYFDIGRNAMLTMDAAQREGSTNYEGVARIMYAFSTLRTTAMFGDMPYTEAITGNPSPKYDPQLFIYGKVLEEIDLAILQLQNSNPNTSRAMTTAQDIVYGGDLAKWTRFAHAIKARAHLHLTPINQNYQAAIDAANLALTGWEDPTFKFPGSGPPIQFNQFGPSQARPNWDFAQNTYTTSAPTPFFLEEVLHYNPETHEIADPRISYLMTPNEDGIFLSIRPTQGKVGSIPDSDYPNLYGSYVTRDNAPLLFFREEELHFIKAEAYFQLGNLPQALASFNAGVIRNFARCGVPASERDAYLASEWMPQNESELQLHHIMMQKHVALWLEGEVWTDMRRYKYDDQVYRGLRRPTNLIFYYGEGEWIQRFPYDTETEEIYNKPELDRLGAYQNPNWLKTPMIWAQ
jgi:hypothetical protein